LSAHVRVEAGQACPLCHGSTIAPERVEIRSGYLDDAAPGASLMLVRVNGYAGLSDDEAGRERFVQAFALREGQAIRGDSDPELLELLTRLRRQLAMAGEDHLPDWYVEMLRDRFSAADREWRWRMRAVDQGGQAIDRSGAWRDRVQKLKADVDLAMLIAYECEAARPNGLGKWICRCPFHQDRSASLSIDIGRGLWHCFGCQIGGDCFTYVELRYGLDFSAAVRHLEQRL
jgi:hypothetical protein